MKDLSIYIHIPFCDHKCIYCDFYSITNYTNETNYLSAIKQEIINGKTLLNGEYKIRTIFFGGGTPSFMTPEYIGEILNTITSGYNISQDCEITMESNPGTVDLDKLKAFRALGINRISLGVQSFDKEELKFLTRIHDSQTAIDNIKLAGEAGFEDINIDLIFNLPGQSQETWLKNLETTKQLPVTHISAYALILERGTILNKMVLDGKVKMQGEDFDADLYEAGINFLTENGFIQYEVSNFARDGYECKHNINYWGCGEYLGFGTSAHSFLDSKRFWNLSSLNLYCASMKKKGIAQAGSEILTKAEQLEEYIMLGLRSKGIDLDYISVKYGENFVMPVKESMENSILKNYFVIDGKRWQLNKAGYAISDEIITKVVKSI